jgi:type I restriction enzyme R subunit
MNAASDYIDLKRLNSAMRYMIDAYIQASDSEVIAKFEDTTLLEIIAKDGIEKAISSLPKAIKEKDETVAETIERNIRTLLVDKQDVNPVYFQKMSFILNELVKKRKEQVLEYQEYLKQVAELAKMVVNKEDPDNGYPDSIKKSEAKKALYDNLNEDEDTANAVDEAIRKVKQH